MASTSGVLVDDNVLEVLRKAQLDDFVNKFVFLFNVRRFDHFSHVRDKDMQDIGMQQQQIRQFREQILKMSREMWNRSDLKQVYVTADQSTPVQSSIDEKALIPYEQIKLHEQIGEGFFAVVKRGTWVQVNGQSVAVAVKMLRDISPSVMDDMKVEASHLLKLLHPSLIRLHGIVRQPAMMVFELCEGGSLLDRLRDKKKPIPPVSLFLNYCIQTAKALQFLESKQCVHRDVAARNILLSKDEKTAKLSDFGLMRTLDDNEDFFTMSKPEKVATAWCAPETLRHGHFSYASDVWSYGVTVWEIFTFGDHPWDGCTAEDILRNIDAGERLEQPEYCSDEIYRVMKASWKSNPHLRSEIDELIEELTTIYEKSIGSAETNRAVATASAVTPQNVPTAATINVQQTIQPTVVTIVNSKQAKEQKAKAERLRVAAFKEKAAPSVHEMQSRNQILQEKFNDFCKKFGLIVDNYKMPTKTIIQKWKNKCVGIKEPLFVTLFEQHLIECGFRHELALYQQIQDFKKQRNKVYRKLRAQKMFDEFINDQAPQKVELDNSQIEGVRRRLDKAFQKTFNEVLQELEDRIKQCHDSFLQSPFFLDLEKVFT